MKYLRFVLELRHVLLQTDVIFVFKCGLVFVCRSPYCGIYFTKNEVQKLLQVFVRVYII